MLCRLVCAIGALALASAPVFAQDKYPSKPVRVLVGLAAGGGTDLAARIFMPKLSDAFGQPFVIENRVGAGGIIATEAVARAAPDGYTLLFSPNGVMVINPTMYRKLTYSPTRDFVPIIQAITFPLVVSVNSDVPAKSVKELVGWLKANPGKANCGGSGPTFELAARLLTSKTGTDCVYVQFKGNNETTQAIMSGQIHFGLIDTGPVFPGIKSGRVRGLAVTTPNRSVAFPDMPTVHEAGFPELDMRFWMGLFAPAGTPTPIVKRLEGEMMKIVKMPDVVKQVEAKQSDISGMGSAEFAKFIASEIERWDSVRKAASIPQVEN
jgi:tripartite-type tricarboxylate transporter receptor subunit TctC